MRTCLNLRVLGCAVVAVAACVTGMAKLADGAVLYSNGSFITDSTTAVPVSTPEIYFNPALNLNTSTRSVGASFSRGVRIADDFVVPASGWQVNSVQLYALQTGQSASMVTKVHLNIWNTTPYTSDSPDLPAGVTPGQPLLAAELVIPVTTGTLFATRSGANVFAYDVPLTDLPGGGLLGAGTYWLDWCYEVNNTAASVVGTPVVTPRASVTDRNARQYTAPFTNYPVTWFEAREGFLAGVSEGNAYAIPFVLSGNAVPEPGAVVAMGAVAMAAGLRRRR